QTAERLAATARRLASDHSMLGVKRWGWALAAMAVAAATFWVFPRLPRGRLDLSRMNVHPMASRAGLETAPAISPDGMWISSLYRASPGDRAQFQVHA